MMWQIDEAATHAKSLICDQNKHCDGDSSGAENSSSGLNLRILWFVVRYVQERRHCQLFLYLF